MEEIVHINAKQRYAFSLGEKEIRAKQGHSFPVQMDFREANPPEVLYHGTSKKSFGTIAEHGLLPMSCQYVHLSLDIKRPWP